MPVGTGGRCFGIYSSNASADASRSADDAHDRGLWELYRCRVDGRIYVCMRCLYELGEPADFPTCRRLHLEGVTCW